MTTSDFVHELYSEFDWRWSELMALKNMLQYEQDTAARDNLRKSLVVVLYSHFEGYCVFALQHYRIAINRAGLKCGDAVPAIVAGAWEGVFNAVSHGDAKCRIFQSSLPNDPGLHRHWRRRHFVEEVARLSSISVEVPEDTIDSESNLKPAVLQRNLFLLGLDHGFVELYAGIIHDLLGRRNRIAHGEERRGVSESVYERYEGAVFEICFKLIECLEQAHHTEQFRKPVPEYLV